MNRELHKDPDDDNDGVRVLKCAKNVIKAETHFVDNLFKL